MATATKIRTFPNSSVLATPGITEAGREHVACVSRRPPGGGPICFVHFVAGDGRDVVPPVDVRPLLDDFEDVALATPFVSGIDGVLKAFCLYKPQGGGNDRSLAIIDTGLVPQVTT